MGQKISNLAVHTLSSKISTPSLISVSVFYFKRKHNITRRESHDVFHPVRIVITLSHNIASNSTCLPMKFAMPFLIRRVLPLFHHCFVLIESGRNRELISQHINIPVDGNAFEFRTVQPLQSCATINIRYNHNIKYWKCMIKLYIWSTLS